ncbi:MAG: hypothetical protein AAF805_08080 [Planctomycetota bacterium]
MAEDQPDAADERVTPRRRGRKPRLGPTERAVIVALVEAGVTRTAAARYVGVAPQTVWNTERRDPEFGQQVERAAARLRLAHLRVIDKVVGRSWRASAWALARLQPERFADPEGRAARRRRARAVGRTRRWLERELTRIVADASVPLGESDRAMLASRVRAAARDALSRLGGDGYGDGGHAA